MIIEVIATTVQEAIDIEASGGDRIELVSGIKEGGLTPSLSLIREVCNNVSIPVNVMIRPHSKSFVYDSHDLKVIYNDIIEVSKTNANGIVFGCLHENGSINEEVLKKVIAIKDNLEITFHRAIDSSLNIDKGIQKLLQYDIHRILTSGGKEKVIDSIEKINHFVSLAKETNIMILAGSGLNNQNTIPFLKKAHVKEIHIGSAAKFNENNLQDINIMSLKKLITKVKEMEEKR